MNVITPEPSPSSERDVRSLIGLSNSRCHFLRTCPLAMPCPGGGGMVMRMPANERFIGEQTTNPIIASRLLTGAGTG